MNAPIPAETVKAAADRFSTHIVKNQAGLCAI